MAQAYVNYIFTMILDRGRFNRISYGDIEDFFPNQNQEMAQAYVDYIQKTLQQSTSSFSQK